MMRSGEVQSASSTRSICIGFLTTALFHGLDHRFDELSVFGVKFLQITVHDDHLFVFRFRRVLADQRSNRDAKMLSQAFE
ncbi:hypothetical protein SFOMI_0445 [Sphingobium fuliginis]|uniref:Uncharacterized protein n=1 Tax=Sphingobium fuliginis (strain ATCC 27551) TaxID=336203 RepID=A0A292ZAQ7_SPHSA|nr:hypothetical protein SFOMI_0445 [Sphingobium fuliginis]